MKQQQIKYVVFRNGIRVGETMAVSEAQAINNYRYSHIGILGMSKEGIFDRYHAVSAIQLEMKKLMAGSSDSKHDQECEQMRLPV